MLKLISSLFSYLKKEKKIQVISEILFLNILKKKKKNLCFFRKFFLIFLIIILFSIKESSDSDQNEKEKISTKLDEKNNYKSDDLSKNTEVEIEKIKK